MVAIVKLRRYACRCSRGACQSRRTLPKHPDAYVRPPKCRQCRVGIYRIDKFRSDGREQRGKTCRCDNYSFPHARGRGYCSHNHRLTAEDHKERMESGSYA